MSLDSFTAMGCSVHVSGGSLSRRESIRELFASVDAIFSRFRPESELRRVNAAGGSAVHVSPRFAAAVSAALEAARASRGLVDPTLGAAIEALGYDTDFHELRPDPRPCQSAPAGDWRTISVCGQLLLRPRGTALDLNGVVKAMTVDEAAGLLDTPGWVAAGGDIATHETTVNVALPGGGAVALEAGGIATSGTATRQWWRGGRLQHHLLDPRTGQPADSPWTHVTALGRSCLSADIAAKAGFLLGAEGPEWLERRGVAARFLGSGHPIENRLWTRGTAAGQWA